MLVLTRKLGEKILIGDDIVITVVDLGDSRTKLGIEAPANIGSCGASWIRTPHSPRSQSAEPRISTG